MTMFSFRVGDSSSPRGAKGYRAYVVGDVHGRLDLLNQLIDTIEREVDECTARKVMLVFLGDLIDRGPQSAQVIERLRSYHHARIRPLFLLGNHEEVLLRILQGETEPMRAWLRYGGAECLTSYGADARRIARQTDEEAVESIRAAIPSDHIEFLNCFLDTCRFGDYLFVHAGIRPGVPLEEQLQSDLRWIREPFLVDDSDHGCIVVHGHTISDEVEDRSNRIGIDTGAYRSGILTALAIEGKERWTLDTRPAAGR
jgi:Uncharacterized protein conserved in bacteria